MLDGTWLHNTEQKHDEIKINQKINSSQNIGVKLLQINHLLGQIQ